MSSVKIENSTLSLYIDNIGKFEARQKITQITEVD